MSKKKKKKTTWKQLWQDWCVDLFLFLSGPKAVMPVTLKRKSTAHDISASVLPMVPAHTYGGTSFKGNTSVNLGDISLHT